MADEDLNMDTDAIALEDTQENSVENEQQSRFITTQRAVDEAKDFDFFSNQSQ